MTKHEHGINHKGDNYNLVSLAVFFAMLVAIAVGIVGIIIRDTTPWVLLLPTVVAAWSILTIKD